MGKKRRRTLPTGHYTVPDLGKELLKLSTDEHLMDSVSEEQAVAINDAHILLEWLKTYNVSAQIMNGHSTELCRQLDGLPIEPADPESTNPIDLYSLSDWKSLKIAAQGLKTYNTANTDRKRSLPPETADSIIHALTALAKTIEPYADPQRH